jgi:hypothetical protein
MAANKNGFGFQMSFSPRLDKRAGSSYMDACRLIEVQYTCSTPI